MDMDKNVPKNYDFSPLCSFKHFNWKYALNCEEPGIFQHKF